MKTNRNLRDIPMPHTAAERAELAASITIFEKIEFSGITKDQIRAKLDDLRTRQVPQREVLLNMSDEDVTFYWFKNWLHPMLKNFFPKSSRDKRGCTPRVLEEDMKKDMLSFYENGQQNYSYTMEDIEKYLNN